MKHAPLTAIFPLIAISLLLAAQPLYASAEADWQTIVRAGHVTISENLTQQEAIAATLKLIDRQETGIRDFLAKYPDDPHRIPATIQLARLLATRSTLTGDPESYASAQRILAALLASPGLTAAQKADIAYAQIALTMRHIRPNDSSAIERLFARIAQFRKDYDGDPRIASLLVSASPLLDSQPARERSLLIDARANTIDAALLREIGDDLLRISLVGKPLALHFTDANGRKINVANYRGKIVVIVFFAEWSPPSLIAAQKLQTFLAAQSRRAIQPIGISLDQSRDSLRHILAAMKIDWPICFDGKGFLSPLVRNLGINALPTVWILDREGRLVAVNSWTNFEATITSLLRAR